MRAVHIQAATALLPAVLLLGGLFGGGMIFAILESLGRPAAFAHYRSLFHDAEFQASMLFTFLMASAATAMSSCLGLSIALAFRQVSRNSRTLNALLQVPIAVPHLVMAIFVVNLFGQSGLIARAVYLAGVIQAPADFPAILHDRYGVGIALSYVLKETPFFALVALAMLRRSGTDYEHAAATLGASPWQCFRHVTLPLVAPAVVSASLIVFAFIFGAFEVPFLLGRPYPAMLGVLAQRRFLSTDLNDRPGAIAAGVLMSAVSSLVVLGYLRLSSRLLGERPTLF